MLFQDGTANTLAGNPLKQLCRFLQLHLPAYSENIRKNPLKIKSQLLVRWLIWLFFPYNFYSNLNSKMTRCIDNCYKGKKKALIYLYLKICFLQALCFSIYFSSKNKCLSFLEKWMTLDKKSEVRFSMQFGRVKKIPNPSSAIFGFSQNIIKSQAWEVLYLFCVEWKVPKFSSVVCLLLHDISSTILQSCK